MTGIEPVTSSLPRKRSTPELHRLKKKLSGRRGSNSRHSAWKADALPTELLPLIFLITFVIRCKGRIFFWSTKIFFHFFVGRGGFEPPKVKTNRFTVCTRWPLEYLPFKNEPVEGFEPTTPRLQITCSGQLSYTVIKFLFQRKYFVIFLRSISSSNGLQR